MRTVDSIANQSLPSGNHVDLVIINWNPTLEQELLRAEIDSVTLLPRSENELTLGELRNRAKQLCNGNVISFLNSGDVLGENTLDKVARFFEYHENTTDVVVIPTKDLHPSSGLFKDGTGQLDLQKDVGGFIQKSLSGVFFDGRGAGEDDFFAADVGIELLFLTSVLSRKLKLGVVTGQECFLEVGQFPSSPLVAKLNRNSVWSFEILESGFIPSLRNLRVRFHGSIPKYFQLVALEELRARLPKTAIGHLKTETELRKYRQLVKELLAELDEDLILNDSSLDSIAMSFLLAFKNGEADKGGFRYDGNGSLHFRGKSIPGSDKQNQARVDLIEVSGKEVTIEGAILGLDIDSRRVTFETTNKKVELNHDFTGEIRADLTREFLGIKWLEPKVFKLRVDLNATKNAEVLVRFEFAEGNGKQKKMLNAPIRFAPMSRLGFGRFAYAWLGEVIASTRRAESFVLEHSSPMRAVRLQALQTAFILKRNGAAAAIADAFHFLARWIGRNNRSWLLIDRRDSGGDNAEYVFREAMLRGMKNAHFVISKDSSGFKRLRKQFGKNIIAHGSLRHRFHFLTCELLLTSFANSSHLNYPIKSPSPRTASHTRFKTVYLQHGVLASGVAHALNRHLKGIELFVVATEFERRSLLSDHYLYSEKNVALTGQPRFDGLWEESTENVIMVAPTWRGHLAKILASEENQRDAFVETTFFEEYSKLLSSQKLHEMLERHDFHLEFYLHPVVYKSFEFFAPLESSRVRIMKPPNKYNYAMSRAALLITDYSGLAYDFAYTRKPLLYAHFDVEEFFALHPHAGSVFDFEATGFGPIAHNSDELIDLIDARFGENMIMGEAYKTRASEFFKFDDQNNSARTLEAIIGLTQS